ncbi:MAG: DUF2892 domain-containing protein [Synechococcaceae cyanobacterium]|nr:DUF2892 domain-containing protein [Synechococcaceae cyanobacterium]
MNTMGRNESGADRLIRLLLGVGLAVAGLASSGGAAIALFVLAAVLLLTAAVGFCPLYRVLGISTCRLSGR